MWVKEHHVRTSVTGKVVAPDLGSRRRVSEAKSAPLESWSLQLCSGVLFASATRRLDPMSGANTFPETDVVNTLLGFACQQSSGALLLAG